METTQIALCQPLNNRILPNSFEHAYHNSKLRYTLKDITACIGNVSRESTIEAIQKSLQICSLTGVKSEYHFKQIYVFDKDIKTLCIDWLMSKSGFNLMLLQMPSLSVKKAQWMSKLVESKSIEAV